MSSPDLRQLEKQLLKRTKIERRAGPKPVRISNLIAQTAWLDGQLIWRDGWVIFQIGEKTYQISNEAIRRTSRALERLENRDLRRELAERIANRRQKFGYLCEIATIEASDLKTLCSVSRRHNPKAIERLGGLLVVESLVPKLLEHSPTRALALAWPLSQSVLESLAKSEVYPAQTRELARFAIANLHFEFWQKNADFPVVLCVKLGIFGHEKSQILEKSGPYSLSYSQIFELLQCGLTPERVLATVDGIRNISNVWFNSGYLKMPELLYNQSDISNFNVARAKYREFEKSSREEINQALFYLSKNDLHAPEVAAKFLIFWQQIWHDSFLNYLKKKHKIQDVDAAHRLFESSFSIVKKLENYVGAKEVLDFALEKSLEIKSGEFKEHVRDLNYCESLLVGLSMSCELACVIGVEKTRQLARRDLWSLKDLHGGPEWLEVAYDLSKLCEGSTEFFDELSRTQNQGTPLSLVKSFGRGIEQELRRFTPRNRSWILDHAFAEDWSRDYVRLLLELYRRYSSKILKFHVGNHQTWADILPVFSCVACRHKWPMEISLRVFDILFEVFKGQFDWSKEYDDLHDAIRIARHLTVLLSHESDLDIDSYKVAVAKALEATKSSLAVGNLWIVGRNDVFIVANRKNLRWAFMAVARRSPRFLLDTITQVSSLKRLHLIEAFDAFEVRKPIQGEQWYRFLARYPQLEAEVRDCYHWSKLAGKELISPPISNRWRDYETKTAREMEFLRTKIVEQPQNLGLQKRLATLEEQWQNLDVWLPNELREALLDASSDFARAAIEKAISSALRNRLRVVCGEIPANLELDNDWINAILLACEVEENRKWAIAILRNCARALVEPEATNWREKIEGNAKFFGEMRKHGKNLDAYTARNERQIGEYTLWIESEPLQILQMGNRFDTCLSRGGINEHSAITNAIDANKKVVYARKHSNIVGRQLICVSEKFELLGYHVYSTIPCSSTEKYVLDQIFHEYASRFAEEVGLEKADQGEVPTLCGASWYDDCEINWASLLEEPPVEKSVSKSRRVKYNSTRLGSETTQKRRKITHSLRHTRGDDSSDSGVGFPTFSSP